MKGVFKEVMSIGLLGLVSLGSGASFDSKVAQQKEQAYKQLALSQEEFEEIPFEDVHWMPKYLESSEDKIKYGKRVFASKNFKIICENGTEMYLVCSFLQTIFGDDRKGIEGFVLGYVRENWELLPSSVITSLIYYLGSERSACVKRLIDSRRLVNLDQKTIDILFQRRQWPLEDLERERDVVNALLDAFFEAATPYCVMYLLSKVNRGQDSKNMKLREGYLKRLVESRRLQDSSHFNIIFESFLLDHEKRYVAMLEDLSDEQQKVVFDYCSYEKQEALLRKNSVDANQRASSLISAQSFLLKDNAFLLHFLEDHFNELTNDLLITFIALLNHERVVYVERLLEGGKLVNVDIKVILSLCNGAIGKYVAKVLLENENFFKEASAFVIVSLVNVAYMYTEPTPRMEYVIRLLKTGKFQSSFDLEKIFEILRWDEKKHVLEVLKDEELDAYQTVVVASVLPFEERQSTLQLLRKNFFWETCYSSGDQETKRGPLFSKTFLERNRPYIMILLLGLLKLKDKTQYFQRMLPAIVQFVKEEYRQDKLVFFHGHHDQWAFLEKLFDDLIAIKTGRPVAKNFVRFRFQERPIFNSDEEVYAFKERVKSSGSYSFFSILFTNLHLFENHSSANSLAYAYANNDQTSIRISNIKFAIEAAIKAFFTEIDMRAEYEALIKENPTVFSDLYDLYKQDVIARGNIGRLAAISMPKEVAQKLAFYSNISAFFVGDGEVVRRAENYCNIPHDSQWCLVLGKEMTDPWEAQKAGIRMASFTGDANEHSVSLADAYETQRIALKSRIAHLHHQRKEDMRKFRDICLWTGRSLCLTEDRIQKQGICCALFNNKSYKAKQGGIEELPLVD